MLSYLRRARALLKARCHSWGAKVSVVIARHKLQLSIFDRVLRYFASSFLVLPFSDNEAFVDAVIGQVAAPGGVQLHW